MILRFARAAWARRIESLVAEQREAYGSYPCADEIRAWQLDRFNERWRALLVQVPFYRSQGHTLPERFETWEQALALLPTIDRSCLQTLGDELTDRTRSPDAHRFTGGTTAQPVRVPVWRSEAVTARADAWYAREWYGVRPKDRLFLIWGHSHLLGTGLSGRVRRVLRAAKDKALGYSRYSAYELGDAALRRAGQALLDERPHWILSYATALDRFVRVNEDRRADFHRLGLKVAIATAEAFPRSDSRERIADVLGCPVAMEYGTVETGPLAHEHPEGGYRVFWRHWFFEGPPVADAGCEGAREVVVTSLFPRCLPLVRYRVGDLVVSDESGVAREFRHVVGRCNDAVELPDGRTIHSEAFTHAVRDLAQVRAFQVVQSADGAIFLDYVAPDPLDAAATAILHRRLRLVHPDLVIVEVRRVPSLPTTIAGKRKPIRREA